MSTAEMAERYKAGATLHAIGKEAGVSYQRVYRELLALGVTMRPAGAPLKVDGQEREELLAALRAFAAAPTMKQIGERFGLGTATLYRIAADHGIIPRRAAR